VVRCATRVLELLSMTSSEEGLAGHRGGGKKKKMGGIAWGRGGCRADLDEGLRIKGTARTTFRANNTARKRRKTRGQLKGSPRLYCANEPAEKNR